MVIGAMITAVPATVAAVSSWRTNQKIKTNHGKNIGQHVEQAALDAADAKLEAQRVRVELARYKAKQDAVNKEHSDFHKVMLSRLPPVE